MSQKISERTLMAEADITGAEKIPVGVANDLAITPDLLYGKGMWRGAYDASGNVYPSSGGSGSAGAIKGGNQWYVSVQGDLDVNGIGVITVSPGAILIALVDTPGQTSSNWRVIQ